jgi:hypothetical protein
MHAKYKGSIPTPRSTRRKAQNAAKRRADEGIGPYGVPFYAGIALF